MTERTIPDFDIDQIARSGQCFRFRPLGEKRYALGADAMSKSRRRTRP